MITKLSVPDLECEACNKLVSKALEKAGATKVEISGTIASVSHKDSIRQEDLLEALSSVGHFAFVKRDLAMGKTEKAALINSLLSLLVLSLAEIPLLYLAFGPSWLYERLAWILLLNITAVSVTGSLLHLASYRMGISCMTGMMLGMVSGMQGGLLSGYVLGATNGFFAGALVSTAYGMLAGYLGGRRGGTMAALQGVMGGFMGGAMGAMTSVMMIGFGFLPFTIWFGIANLAILLFFSVLVLENVPRHFEERPIGFLPHLGLNAITIAAFALLVAYGPKGLVFF